MRNESFNKSSKKATNLSLSSDLLAEAKRLKINLSATMEKALKQEVSERLSEEWLENNSDAVNACNKLTESFGLFSDAYRKF